MDRCTPKYLYPKEGSDFYAVYGIGTFNTKG